MRRKKRTNRIAGSKGELNSRAHEYATQKQIPQTAVPLPQLAILGRLLRFFFEKYLREFRFD